MFEIADPRIKKLLRRLSFVFLALAVAVLSFIVLLAAMGYDINRRTGEVIKNGLLLVDAAPERADIYINGRRESEQTPGRLPLPASNYDVVLRRSGYRDWQKKIRLEGNEVEWVYYPKLIPNTVVTTEVTSFDALQGAKQSRDKRWIAFTVPGSEASFVLYDLDNPDAPLQPVVLAPGTVTKRGNFAVIEWAGDNRTFILENRYDNAVEYILVDRVRPGDSINLTTRFQLPFVEPRFRNADADEVFVVENQNIRLIDVRANTVSEPLANSIIDYQSFGGGTVVYVHPAVSGNPDHVSVSMVRDGKAGHIREMIKSDEYFLDMKTYEGTTYLGVAANKDALVTLFRNPSTDNQPAADYTARMENIASLSLSEQGQYLATQSGSNFSVYDIEEEETYAFSLERQFQKPAVWMDGHRLTAFDHEGKVILFEFDGSNFSELATASSDFGLFFDKTFEQLYSVDRSSATGRMMLQQSNLVAAEP